MKTWKKRRDGVTKKLQAVTSSVKNRLQDAVAERLAQPYSQFVLARGKHHTGASGAGSTQVVRAEMSDGGLCPSVSRIFDHCLVLRYITSESTVKITHLLSHPDVSTLPPSVAQFCFPDSQSLSRSKTAEQTFPTDNFTFTLTESDGTRIFGFSRRFSPNILGLPASQKFASNNSPVCICILSRHSFFGFFDEILEYLQVRWLISPRAFFPFIELFLRESVPPANQLFNISLGAEESLSSDKASSRADPALEFFTFQRIVYTSGATVSLETLFDKLSVGNVLTIVAAMLCERRILLLSSSLGAISGCIHALAALIFPFSWQHIFIPLLPSKLVSYVCAPMPFLIGAQMSDLPEIERMPLEEGRQHGELTHSALVLSAR